MVIGDDALNDSLSTANSPISNTQNDDPMNQSSLEMMESIIQSFMKSILNQSLKQ